MGIRVPRITVNADFGDDTAFDGSGTEGESTPLERFDSVVFTVA